MSLQVVATSTDGCHCDVYGATFGGFCYDPLHPRATATDVKACDRSKCEGRAVLGLTAVWSLDVMGARALGQSDAGVNAAGSSSPVVSRRAQGETATSRVATLADRTPPVKLARMGSA